MNYKRPSDREYDRFADDLKEAIYDKMDAVKAFMACFIVDDKIEFWKKTWYTLEWIRSLVEKELWIVIKNNDEECD